MDSAPTSVVIVNFRAYRQLRTCLASLGAGTPDELPVVVVDQVPRASRLARLRKEFPRVTFIESGENKGFAAGVNLGAKHARGEFLAVINPDGTVTPAAIWEIVHWMKSRPEVGVVGPRICDPNGAIQASARRFPDFTTAFAGRSSWLTRAFPGNWLSRRNLVIPADAIDPIEVDWVSGACFIVRRAAFDEVGGLDQRFFLYWEDADLGRRLKTAGWTTVYYPGVQAVHTVAGSSRFAPVRSAFAFHRSALRYYWKHASPASRLIVPLVALGLGTRLVLLLAWNYSRQFARHSLRASP